MKGNNPKTRYSKISAGIIAVMIILTIIAAVCALCIPNLKAGFFTSIRLYVAIAGTVVAAAGLAMLITAKVQIKRWGVEYPSELITKGVFAWVRNPFCSSVLFICTGALMIVGNFYFLILPLIYWIMVGLVLRETEEKMLKGLFGKAYDDYCDSVSRLLPWFPNRHGLGVSEYRKILRLTFAGIVVSSIIIYLLSRAITALSAQMTYEATLDMKKSMLRENVENMISYIEEYREMLQTENPEITQEELDNAVYKMAYMKIYSETHVDGTYMWVNKVLNYEGGDDYAIRLIHPNLSETEGSFLSTETVNASGNKAYEEELEGVKENGGVYINYTFKKLDSDNETEKVTYSELYKDMDWIVCMGVNIDDLSKYRENAEEKLGTYRSVLMIATTATWLGFLAIMFYVYRRTKIDSYESRNKELSDKLNNDALTGAGSRRYGDEQLEKAFEDYKAGQENILLLIMDIDYFKCFNDNFGHEFGDKVLKTFVDAVKNSTRSNDEVIRWGGDEFIVILQNVPPKYQPETADRILESVRNIELEELDGKHITASMGFAYFREEDLDAKSALARADEALYRAKEDGRNNWKI